VYSSLSFNLSNAARVLGDVENLALAGTAAINGTGNALANFLTGNDGINVLIGGGGNDSLDGKSGADKLTGGPGADRLIGGMGADLFTFKAIAESNLSGSGRDAILDFSHAQADKIDLRLIDAQTNVAGNQAFHFIGTAAFSHHSGELRYATQSGNVTIHGDINGDGTADISVQLNQIAAIQASDFLM
jgi:serralysin